MTRPSRTPETYRPEIDGLRAVAVLAVIFCHAGFAAFQGGYAGVDVFYVISGFLITGILRREIAFGRFSLMEFYERRVRRIVPALFVVIAACVPLAWLLMLPREFRDFGQSLVAVNVFLSNLFFRHESGYFDIGTTIKPLVHTWSLAVEEQFYLLFPLALFVILRFARRWAALLLAIAAIASIAWAQLSAKTDPSGAFFLASTRAWELLAGALLAFAEFDRQAAARRAPVLFETLGLSGLALIAMSVLLFDDKTPWPTLLTLTPVLGAVLVIAFATPGTVAYRLLASRPMTAVGLISYSAYLWHQPTFAFARLFFVDRAIATGGYIALTLVVLGLAYLSWRYVEMPFRSRSFLKRRTLFVGAGMVAASFMAIGLWVHLGAGLPWRFDPEAQIVAAGEWDVSPYRDSCGNKTPADFHGYCVFGTQTDHTVAIVGDSHSTELTWQTEEHLQGHSFAVQEFTYNDCPPFVGLTRGETTPCQEFIARSRDYILGQPRIDTIVLAANWEYYFNCPKKQHCMTAATRIDLASDDSDAGRVAALASVMDRDIDAYLAAGKTVVLVSQVPKMPWNVPRYMLARERMSQSLEDVAEPAQADLAQTRRVRDFLTKEAAKPGVLMVNPHAILCTSGPHGLCRAQRNGWPLYFDDGHMNGHGAALIAAQLLKVLDAAEAGPKPAAPPARATHV